MDESEGEVTLEEVPCGAAAVHSNRNGVARTRPTARKSADCGLDVFFFNCYFLGLTDHLQQRLT